MKQKLATLAEIQKYRNSILSDVQVATFSKEIKTNKLRRSKRERIMSEADTKNFGTVNLGNVDKFHDGEETRRDRRQIIVIKQKRGDSLDLTLRSDKVLESLGMSFDKFVVPSPTHVIASPKNQTIILK